MKVKILMNGDPNYKIYEVDETNLKNHLFESKEVHLMHAFVKGNFIYGEMVNQSIINQCGDNNVGKHKSILFYKDDFYEENVGKLDIETYKFQYLAVFCVCPEIKNVYTYTGDEYESSGIISTKK